MHVDELHSASGTRAAFEAFYRDGILVLEGLPTHDEEDWAKATRAAFVRLLPERAGVAESAYWERGDATSPSFNDYTNEGREATLAVTELDGQVAEVAPEHPGWYGGALKLHQDGCYLETPPRLKLYAPWGADTLSIFADGRHRV